MPIKGEGIQGEEWKNTYINFTSFFHGWNCRGVRAPRRRLATVEARVVPPVWGVVCWEGFLDLIIKLLLIFRSRHLVLL
jgi:hypothetical protein